MQTELPFFESPEDALRTAVQSLGGAKQVGPMLWPDKGVDASSRILLDCLNTGRPEKLELSQIVLIFSKAKEAGCHGPFAWFAGEIGYDTKPITKAEEVDRLTTVIEQSSKTFAAAVSALERIQNGTRIGLVKSA